MRSFLTISGITIGVLALVVMGAMAEKLNKMVDGAIDYYEGTVIVSDAASDGYYGAPVMSLSVAERIEDIEGVGAVSSSVSVLLEEQEAGISVGPPPSIIGVDLKGTEYQGVRLEVAQGRDIGSSDRGVVVLGSDLVRQLDTDVGETVELRGEKFKVIGVYDKTLSVPDSAAFVYLDDAQRLFASTLPAVLRDSVDTKDLVTEIAVYPEPNVDADALAETINEEVEGVIAIGPTEWTESMKRMTATFSAIMVGIAFISLLIGGMSVINTMMMSVSERVREIGIRKAVGASTGHIVRHFIAESAVIGLVGGLLGLGLGAALAATGNAAGEASGTILFLVSPRLALGSVAFAVVLGVIAGLYPAVHASRLDPVVAFRRA